jgi:hypothetical protein
VSAYYARVLLGWAPGTPFEQSLIAAMKIASWSELTQMALGWPDLVSAFLLPQAELERLARQYG